MFLIMPKYLFDEIYGFMEAMSKIMPFLLLLITVGGLVIAKFKFGLSYLQPIEKLRNQQVNYEKRLHQEDLKRIITDKHLLLGNELIKSGHWEVALEEFQKALKTDKYNKEASWGIFKCQTGLDIKQKKYPFEVLKQKINLIANFNPSDAHASYFMGMLYREHDNPQEPIRYFKKAISLDEMFTDAYYRLAMIYETRDQLNTVEALPLYEKAHNLAPLNLNYINNYAYINFQTGNFQEAIKLYDKLIKLDNDDLLPYLTMSHAHLRMGEVKKSVKKMSELIYKIEHTPTLLDSELNSMHWFFESFENKKILLSTNIQKLAYIYLSAYYKNLICKFDFDMHAIYLNKASVFIKSNLFGSQMLLELINFEITYYTRDLRFSQKRRAAIRRELKKVFSEIYNIGSGTIISSS